MPKATQLVSNGARIQTQVLNLYTVNCHEDDDLDCGGTYGHGSKSRHESLRVQFMFWGIRRQRERIKTASQKIFRAGKGRSQEVRNAWCLRTTVIMRLAAQLLFHNSSDPCTILGRVSVGLSTADI